MEGDGGEAVAPGARLGVMVTEWCPGLGAFRPQVTGAAQTSMT
jgi:hypothetical protein